MIFLTHHSSEISKFANQVNNSHFENFIFWYRRKIARMLEESRCKRT
jgi:hypothetical protein